MKGWIWKENKEKLQNIDTEQRKKNESEKHRGTRERGGKKNGKGN